MFGGNGGGALNQVIGLVLMVHVVCVCVSTSVGIQRPKVYMGDLL